MFNIYNSEVNSHFSVTENAFYLQLLQYVSFEASYPSIKVFFLSIYCIELLFHSLSSFISLFFLNRDQVKCEGSFLPPPPAPPPPPPQPPPLPPLLSGLQRCSADGRSPTGFLSRPDAQHALAPRLKMAAAGFRLNLNGPTEESVALPWWSFFSKHWKRRRVSMM